MQILVVVANIQVRTLKAEVEKGFMRTAVDHELIDPKAEINLLNGKIGVHLCARHPRSFPMSKGNQVNIPESECSDIVAATQKNLETLAGALERVLFSF